MIRGVIFNLFHTLTGVESEWSTVPFTSDVLGVSRERWDDVLHAHSRWRLTGEERDPWRILRRLADVADASIPDALVTKAVDARGRRFREALAKIPVQNKETLRRLRASGLRRGLISNADASEIAGWQDSPLCGLFDVEVFSCETGAMKPEPAIYEACLQQLGLRAPECLFVGDGGSDELIGAKAVGLRTVFLSGVIAELWPQRLAGRLATADHHVVALPEIETIIAELSCRSSTN